MEIRKQSQEKEVGFLGSWTKCQMERYLQSSLHCPSMGVSDQQSNKSTGTASHTETRRKFGNGTVKRAAMRSLTRIVIHPLQVPDLQSDTKDDDAI